MEEDLGEDGDLSRVQGSLLLMVRAVHKLNLLPRRVVESLSLEVFRRRLDKHLSGVSDL